MPPGDPELHNFNCQCKSVKAGKPCEKAVWVAETKRGPCEKIDCGMLHNVWEICNEAKRRRHDRECGNCKK